MFHQSIQYCVYLKRFPKDLHNNNLIIMPITLEIPEKGTKSTASSPSFLFDGDDFDDNHKNAIQWAGYQSRSEPERWLFLALCPRTGRLALIQRNMFSAPGSEEGLQ
jgi:hypothetical protein